MRYKILHCQYKEGQYVSKLLSEENKHISVITPFALTEGHDIDARVIPSTKYQIVPLQAERELLAKESPTYFVNYFVAQVSRGTLSLLGIKKPYNRSHWGALGAASCSLISCYISIIEPELSVEAFFLAIVYGAFTFAFVRQAKRKQNNNEEAV